MRPALSPQAERVLVCIQQQLKEQPFAYDLIIAGDGPAGISAAFKAASAGLSVLVLAPSKQRPTAGLLTPLGQERFQEIFGPLPDDAVSDGPRVKGYALHFPSQITLRPDFTAGTGAYVLRPALLRHMIGAAIAAGAEIAEGAEAITASQIPSGVEVLAKTGTDERKLRAKALICADGFGSAISRQLYPRMHGEAMRATLFTHAIVDSAIEEDRVHVWVGEGIGVLCIAYLSGGRCSLVILRRASEAITELHERAVGYIKERSGLWLQSSPEQSEEAQVEMALAARGSFSPGKGNIALAGEAAGFICPPLEGMSAAIGTGAMAGQAAAAAIRQGGSISERYSAIVKPEILRVADQWQPVRLLFASPHEVDIKSAFRALKDDDQYTAGSDIMRHMRANGLGLGFMIVMRGIRRQIMGGY